MRIRLPFAAAFVVLLGASGYLGLAPIIIPTYYQSDKGLHFITLFLLTLTFYWILETSRRRALNLTLITCTAVIGIGSEILQGILDNNREFDYFDIVANLLGSAAALGLCAWYHRRMLERKRAAKTYHVVPGADEENGGELGLRNEDVELGEGVGLGLGLGLQGTGVTRAGQREGVKNIDQELDNWDENVEDEWDEEEPPKVNGSLGVKAPYKENGDVMIDLARKRDD